MTSTVASTARAKAIAWARSVAADPTTIYLDLETSGLGEDAEIVDICILRADGQVRIDSLVRPSRPIPTEASAIHGITDDDVKHARPWGDIAPIVADIVGCARNAVIYNVAYDSNVISQNCRAFGVPEIVANWQCALLAYADFAGVLGRFGGYKWHRLTSAAENFGIDTPGAHRARADCETTRLVVCAMARTEEEKQPCLFPQSARRRMTRLFRAMTS